MQKCCMYSISRRRQEAFDRTLAASGFDDFDNESADADNFEEDADVDNFGDDEDDVYTSRTLLITNFEVSRSEGGGRVFVGRRRNPSFRRIRGILSISA